MKARGERYCVVCKTERHVANRMCPPVVAIKAQAESGGASRLAWCHRYAGSVGHREPRDAGAGGVRFKPAEIKAVIGSLARAAFLVSFSPDSVRLTPQPSNLSIGPSGGESGGSGER